MTNTTNEAALLASKPPAFILEIAVGIIEHELGAYLDSRHDVTSADIDQGFEPLAKTVVESCYAAIKEAERHLILRGDPEAFERELRRYSRMCGKAWADHRLPTPPLAS